MVDYLPLSDTSGNVRAICPICDMLMYRRMPLAKIEALRTELDVTFPQAMQPIGD